MRQNKKKPPVMASPTHSQLNSRTKISNKHLEASPNHFFKKMVSQESAPEQQYSIPKPVKVARE